MQDLTQGSIPKHLAALALPMAAGMLLQTLYLFVDLYFVASLGDAAIAGVAAAGNLMFASFAMTQMLAAATGAMVAQAVGRKDQADANHVFNQAVGVAALFTLVTLIGGYAIVGPFTRFFGADEASREAGAQFLRWVLPSLALQYAMVVMSAGLRGTGIVKPAAIAQLASIGLNIVLAPVLVAGWGTGAPMGVAGAGLATSLSTLTGVLLLLYYFVRLEHYVGFDPTDWWPQAVTWKRVFNIGLPAGGEFALMAITAGIMYWAARDFGAEVQAGVGVGFRLNQMLFILVVAVAMAAAPLAGQNYGARNAARVRETLRVALLTGSAIMLAVTIFVQVFAEWLARIFTSEAAVIVTTAQFLHYLGLNFLPSAIAFICSALFQALGNTWPALASTGLRVTLFAIGGVWLAKQPGFEMRHIYMLSVATVILQAVIAYGWLRREMAKRLTFS